ncbi:hypothetical protein BKA62DRAFT_673176 [Auriculariales sp. MPI-PUGE-AT-0066]|nr:hypothetical protein BKA62DRAFT_673176 [Auriculariales sp. MPI-PUGE-AT-0066]
MAEFPGLIAATATPSLPTPLDPTVASPHIPQERPHETATLNSDADEDALMEDADTDASTESSDDTTDKFPPSFFLDSGEEDLGEVIRRIKELRLKAEGARKQHDRHTLASRKPSASRHASVWVLSARRREIPQYDRLLSHIRQGLEDQHNARAIAVASAQHKDAYHKMLDQARLLHNANHRRDTLLKHRKKVAVRMKRQLWIAILDHIGASRKAPMTTALTMHTSRFQSLAPSRSHRVLLDFGQADLVLAAKEVIPRLLSRFVNDCHIQLLVYRQLALLTRS